MRQALNVAAGDPNVRMFIWFILRDDPTSAWKSGLVERDGQKKPAFAAFAALAKRYDGRSPQLIVRPGVRNPLVSYAALELWSRSGAGARVGMTVTVYDGARRIGVTQPVSTIGRDGWVSFRAPLTTVKGHVYRVYVTANDIHGDTVDRMVTIEVPAKPGG